MRKRNVDIWRKICLLLEGGSEISLYGRCLCPYVISHYCHIKGDYYHTPQI